MPNDLLDALMTGYKNPEDLNRETGLLKQLTKETSSARIATTTLLPRDFSGS